MRLLLDTNVLLWALDQPERLPAPTLAQLQDTANDVHFSAASIWEIAIKSRLGREDFNYDPDQITRAACRTGFTELPITSAVVAKVATLPLHHGDPFDRFLVVQAMAGPMRFLTSDTRLQVYSELVSLVP